MSLMNDALRKKKKESKHPSGSAIFEEPSGKKPKNRFRIYAIAALFLLACATGGYYFYEMMSLSQPMTPVLQSPMPAEPGVSPPEEPVLSGQDSGMPVSSETAMPKDTLAEKHVAPSKTTPMKPATPAPEPKLQKTTPATAPLKTDEQPPEKKQKSLTTNKTPPPVIEPEESTPQPVPAGEPNLNQAENTVTAIKTETDSVEELFYRKGVSYHRQNKLELAIQMYQVVLRRNPEHRSTRFNLASAYIQMTAFMEARAILEKLNQQEPGNPEVLLNLAAVEIGLDRPEEALTFLESAEEASAVPTFEILFHKGAAYSRMGNFEKALGIYQREENLAPENARHRLNMAIVYDSLAQYDQAIAYYQTFLDGNTSLAAAERNEIELRVRELKAYLSQRATRSVASTQAGDGKAE